MEQLVARWAHNPKVTGSSPVSATTKRQSPQKGLCFGFKTIGGSMLYTVYALYSKKYDKIYIGYTSNLIKRFHSHNELGIKGHTVRYRPWEVVYTEIFNSKNEAMKREKELKSYQGRCYIRKLIEE